MGIRVVVGSGPAPERPGTAPRALRKLFDQCRGGVLPAEILPAYARDWLVHELHGMGWSDVEIATHTRMSTYTTGRIRDRLGLEPNPLPRDPFTDARATGW